MDNLHPVHPFGENHDPVDAEDEINSILVHPLYGVISLLMKETEQATRMFGSKRINIGEIMSSVRSQLTEKWSKKPSMSLLTGNAQLDEFMILSIDVFKIHLMELERLDDLVRDFNTRYVDCIKSKLNIDSVVGSEEDFEDDQDPSSSPGTEDSFVCVSKDSDVSAQPAPGISCSNVSAQAQISTSSKFAGATGASLPLYSTSDWAGLPTEDIGALDSSSSTSPPDKRTKRTSLSKPATGILKTWLFQNIGHPYPTEMQKEVIAAKANLSVMQVNNWFINARRRLLHPCLKEPTQGREGKSKNRMKSQNRQTASLPPTVTTAASHFQAGENLKSAEDQRGQFVVPSSNGLLSIAQPGCYLLKNGSTTPISLDSNQSAAPLMTSSQVAPPPQEVLIWSQPISRA